MIWADGLYHLQLLLDQRRAPRHPLAGNPKFGCSFGYCEPSGIMVVRGKKNLDFRNSFIGTWISRPRLPRSGSANDCTSLRKRNVTHHRCAGLVNVSRKVFDFTLVPTNNFFVVFQHHFRFGVLPYYIKNILIPSALLLTSLEVYPSIIQKVLIRFTILLLTTNRQRQRRQYSVSQLVLRLRGRWRMTQQSQRYWKMSPIILTVSNIYRFLLHHKPNIAQSRRRRCSG